MYKLLLVTRLEMNSPYFRRSPCLGLSQSTYRKLTVTGFLGEGKAGRQNKVQTKVIDDGKVKRAPNAFNLYIRSAFPALKPSLGEKVKATELMIKTAAMWKGLSPEARAPFKAEADVLKAAVTVKREALKKNNTRPFPPYASFVKSTFLEHQQLYPEIPTKHLMRKIAESWRNVSAEERALLLDNYKQQMIAWKEKNISEISEKSLHSA